MIRAASAFLLLLAACSPAPVAEPEPAPAPPAAEAPVDLKALEAAHDWQNEPGEKLNADWDAGVKALLGKMSRPDIIGAVNAAGFECIYGEGHPDYPDPAAQCTRSFATRACQMDWEIFSTAENGMVDEVDGSFTRDCVGVDQDWPEPVKSAIDDQLAPAAPPQ
jgi:hypothetical protein